MNAPAGSAATARAMLALALAAASAGGGARPLAPVEPRPAAGRPDPADPAIAARQRLIEASQRSARAGPPPALAPPPPESGIVQIPVDLGRRIGPDKAETAAAARSAARLSGATAIQPPAPPDCPTYLPFTGPALPLKTASIVRIFPDLQWHICVTDMARKGLWIGPVELRRGETGPWMQVIGRAGPAEIFVPYHVEPSARWYDLQGPVRMLSPISEEDVGPTGYRIKLTNESFPTVAAELRSRGPAWICKGTIYARSRRSEEFVLWAISDAGNYDNIIEYSFRDDGAIGFRMGNTGYNSPPRPAEAHTHNVLWYVDIDLNGPGNDYASMLTHDEAASPTPLDALDAQDAVTPFQTEGARQWEPARLGSLLIEDFKRNKYGHRLGYEFSPVQSALTRHHGPRETWTLNDVYLTRFRIQNLAWANPYVGPTLLEQYATYAVPDEYLLPALDGQPVPQHDLVVWIKSAAHHVPTDEDRTIRDSFLRTEWGVTLTHWTGFRMEPHNLFEANPNRFPPPGPPIPPIPCDPL